MLTPPDKHGLVVGKLYRFYDKPNHTVRIIRSENQATGGSGGFITKGELVLFLGTKLCYLTNDLFDLEPVAVFLRQDGRITCGYYGGEPINQFYTEVGTTC